jgi:D-alanine-D-alanine ligase
MPARRRSSTRPKGLRVAVLYNHDPDAPTDVADVAHAADDITTALREGGYRPTQVPVDGAAPLQALSKAIDALRRSRTELVFNLCEAVGGRSAHEPLVPHLLELAGLPYTGSSSLGLGLALRKDRARLVLAGAGVPIAAGTQYDAVPRRAPALVFPLFVKLAGEDASVGIDAGSVVHDFHALARRVESLLARYPGPVLVEEFIPGREIYVSLVGPGPIALPPHEIDFSGMPADVPPIVTYAGKWDPASPESLGSQPVRARRLGKLGPELAAIARRVFMALGLTDYARVDFRVDVAGRPYVIDVNPNCDLSAGAGMARAAGFGGWSHAELVDRICRSALLRSDRGVARRGPRRRR